MLLTWASSSKLKYSLFFYDVFAKISVNMDVIIKYYVTTWKHFGSKLFIHEFMLGLIYCDLFSLCFIFFFKTVQRPFVLTKLKVKIFASIWITNHARFFIEHLLKSYFPLVDACNSRTVPRPRTTQAPPKISTTTSTTTTTTSRPKIEHQIYQCPDVYAKWYCLNGATCFAVKISEEFIYNCE